MFCVNMSIRSKYSVNIGKVILVCFKISCNSNFGYGVIFKRTTKYYLVIHEIKMSNSDIQFLQLFCQLSMKMSCI